MDIEVRDDIATTSEMDYDDAVDNLVEGETDITTEDLVGDEGFADDSIDDLVEDGIIIEEGIDGEYFDEGAYLDSEFYDGEYMDPGFYEGEYMDTGMEMGMSELKDPLLSSWPFVIGISAAIFVVSIALGALLARLKIKKGIDLYED